MTVVYDFAADGLDGRKISLNEFAGKVLLIVNTASHCGFTPQYEGLQQLHTSLSPRGFAVLGFPCNQFGKQEPGDAGAIADFCESNYHVTFPLFAKIEVNGDGAHPLYRFLKAQCPGLMGSQRSSGTSPSSWSTAPGTRSRVMPRPRRRKRLPPISRRCSRMRPRLV